MFRVWAAKEEVSVELNFGFAKIKTLYTGTKSLQQFSFIMQLPAIQMNQCDAFQSFRTSQIFVWIWHFQLQLSTPNLTYGFVSYESDYWDTIYPEITTQLSVNSWGWQYISGDYLHLNLNLIEESAAKSLLKAQSILWGIFIFLKFLLLCSIQQGNQK